MIPQYSDYIVMFFAIIVIMVVVGKILRLQFSFFNIGVKEGMTSDESSTDNTKKDSCINTTQSIDDINDKIEKKLSSISASVTNKDTRSKVEQLITSYHDMLSVWAIHDLMVTDASSTDCVNKMIGRLSTYGNAKKCLETSLEWLDAQP